MLKRAEGCKDQQASPGRRTDKQLSPPSPMGSSSLLPLPSRPSAGVSTGEALCVGLGPTPCPPFPSKHPALRA